MPGPGYRLFPRRPAGIPQRWVPLFRSEYAQFIKGERFLRQPGPRFAGNALRKVRKYSVNHVVEPPGTNPREPAWPWRGRNYRARTGPNRDSSAGFRFATLGKRHAVQPLVKPYV